MQEKFDWKAVGMAAIGSGVSAGLGRFSPFKVVEGASKWANAGNAAANGALSSVITQGVGVATGLQDKFSWSSVAVQAVSAGVGSVVGDALPGDLDPAFRSVVGNWVGGVAGAGAQSLIEGTSFGDNLRAALPGLIANTIGGMISDQISQSAADRLADRTFAEQVLSDVEAYRGEAYSAEERAAREAELIQDRAEARRFERRGDHARAGEAAQRVTDTYLSDIGTTAKGREALDQRLQLLQMPDDYIASKTRATFVDDGSPKAVVDEVIVVGKAQRERVISKFADNLAIDTGVLTTNLASEANRLIDETPGARLAVSVLDLGMTIAGGPIRAAAAIALRQAEGQVIDYATGLFADKGYTDTAQMGGLGLVVLPQLAIGGLRSALSFGKLLRSGSRTASSVDVLRGRARGIDLSRSPDGWVRPKGWRLPRTGGDWAGTPGNSAWSSTVPSVRAITKGEPVPFVNGYPDFSRWSKGELTVRGMTGTRRDDGLILDALKEKYNFRTQDEARQFLRDQQLTPHHLQDGKTIQLVPEALNRIPHQGGAAILRTDPS